MRNWTHKEQGTGGVDWIKVIVGCGAVLMSTIQALDQLRNVSETAVTGFQVLAAAIVFYAIYPMMIQALRRNQAAQDQLSGHLTATRTKIDKLEENLKRLGDGQRD